LSIKPDFVFLKILLSASFLLLADLESERGASMPVFLKIKKPLKAGGSSGALVSYLADKSGHGFLLTRFVFKT
jgi:hypothetical protein